MDRLAELVEKVATLASTAELSPAEKAEYNDLCADWFDRERVEHGYENYGF